MLAGTRGACAGVSWKTHFLRNRSAREPIAADDAVQTLAAALLDVPVEQMPLVRQEEAKRQAARWRILAVEASALMMVLVGLLIAVWIQRNEARTEAAIASSRLLAAQSQQALQTDLDVALHQAVAAGERWPTEEAEQALRKVLDGPLLRMVLHHPLGLGNLSFAPDGRRVLTTYYEFARIWDVESGHILTTFVGHTGNIPTSGQQIDWPLRRNPQCRVFAGRKACCDSEY